MERSASGGAPGVRRYWPGVITFVGAVLVIVAIGNAAVELSRGNVLLEAGLDLFLLSAPGIVMLYVGLWLPGSAIDARFYPRTVGWMVGGIVVMGVVLGLRVVHPGVTVEFTFGTQAVLLAIGSIAGLGIGINKAQALTHAGALEVQNQRLSETERDLEEAVEQLEASNERLEQFAYAASHDLQEPLRMVISYLKLVEQRHGDEFDAESREFVDFAVDGAERMQAMIQGLLEYSRVETQGGSFETVDLDDVLNDVLTDLQFRIEETDATISREPLPSVTGDGRQLQQLFQNLVGNAIEYSGDEPPEIFVTSNHEDDQWRIAVRDEGIGIDVEDTGRIFEVFQRLHSVEDHEGSGIGLALCKRIVERHDGDLRVDSEPGAGSTFSFTLPERVERVDAPEVTESSDAAGRDTSGTRRVDVQERVAPPSDTD